MSSSVELRQAVRRQNPGQKTSAVQRYDPATMPPPRSTLARSRLRPRFSPPRQAALDLVRQVARRLGGQHETSLGPRLGGQGRAACRLPARQGRRGRSAGAPRPTRGAASSSSARVGVTFDVLAEEWLAWGIRDRDWKPSTLSDNRSVLNAHLLPAFGGQAGREDHARGHRAVARRARRRARRQPPHRQQVPHHPRRDPRARRQGPRPAAQPRHARSPSCASAMTPTRTTSTHPRRSSSSPAARRLRPGPGDLPHRRLHRPAHGRAHRPALGRRRLRHRSRCTSTAPTPSAPSPPRSPASPGPSRWPSRSSDLLKAHRKRVPHARADLVFPGERGEYLDGSALRRRYKKALEKAELRTAALPRPAPHLRVDRHRPGHDRPGPGVDGPRRRADDHEVHAPPQPRRRRPASLGGVPARRKKAAGRSARRKRPTAQSAAPTKSGG